MKFSESSSHILQMNSIYKHYKGNLYKIIQFAKHSETQEELVIYQDLSSPEKVWARPILMFCETVNIDGTPVPRFSKTDVI